MVWLAGDAWSRPWVWLAGVALLIPVVVAGLLAQPMLVLAAIGLIAAVVVGWSRPWLLVLALVVLLPFNGLASQLLGRGATATAGGAVKDLLLLLLLAVAVAGRRRGSAPPWLRAPVTLLLLLPFLFAVVTAEQWGQALYGWRNDYYPLLLLLVVPALLGPSDVRRITSAVAGMAQVVGVVGVATWTRHLNWLVTLGILPPQDQFPFQFFSAGSITPRAFSPYAAPNELGLAVAISLAVIWCRGDWSTRRRLLLSVLPVVALVLSQSRSGLLGLGAVAVVLFLRRQRRTAGVGTAASTAVLLAAAGGVAALYWLTSGEIRDPSTIGHVNSVQESLLLPLAHPLGVGVGEVGPRALRFAQNPILVESFWLLIGIEAGVLALLVYLLVLGRIVGRTAGAETLQGYLPVAALAASLPSQLLLPAMQEGAVSYLLWIAVGCGLASWAADRAAQPEYAASGRGPRS